MQKPIFKIYEVDGEELLTITRDNFCHRIRYRKVLNYQLFNDGYSIAMIIYDSGGLCFVTIRTKNKFITTRNSIDVRPQEEADIQIRPYRGRLDGVYCMYVGIDGNTYVIDMQGSLGFIELKNDKFNFREIRGGSYFYLDKKLLDEILTHILR